MHGELILVDDVPAAFAARFVRAFQNRRADVFSVALSGGGTARACYEQLARSAGDEVDWNRVAVYWGDERCVSLDDPDSNYRLAREALLDRVGALHACHPMRCDEGAERYEQLVRRVGAFDLVHLGLGPDGHTASLFPGSPALDADPAKLVVTNDDPRGNNPHPRMTFTLTALDQARSAVVTVEGDEKRDALARVAADEPLPAARVRTAELVWLADAAATADVPEELIIRHEG